MSDNPDDVNLPFIQRAIAVAAYVDSTLTGDPAEVVDLVDGHDLVIDVWPEPAEPHGFGITYIKGLRRLRESITSGAERKLSWTAIPCVDAEHAVALRNEVGEVDWLH